MTTPLGPDAQALLSALTQSRFCCDPADVPNSATDLASAAAQTLRVLATQGDWANVTIDDVVLVVTVDRILGLAAELEGWEP